MAHFHIEKVNIRVPGHNGYGRLNLIGKNEFNALTNNQAAKIIGDAVIKAYNKWHYEQHIDDKTEGVSITIVAKRYKRKIRKR